MADISLPAPTNKWVSLIKVILDNLIDGAGVEITISAATAYAPWLAWPVISTIFRSIISNVADYLDLNAFKVLAKFTIRLQGDARRKDLDNAVAIIKKPGATAKEIQDAKDAIDRLVNRNRP